MTTAVDAPGDLVHRVLERYRSLTVDALLAGLPAGKPAHLYDLVRAYPSRPAKGLRGALCLATCAALGGDVTRGLNAASTVELFHNAFLVLDDIQDESEQRRGAPTIWAEHGVGVALNVGSMTNLLGLQRLMANRRLLGSALAWTVFEETELMLRHSLEGQAMEIGWIRDNVCDLVADDYYRMCLKKTSWYTCIYPCRIGVLLATGSPTGIGRLDRFGWFLGAAFQLQDDILNLVGDYARYGKEISGDLWEGKRTLMLIDFLQRSDDAERARARRFLATARSDRSAAEVRWLHGRLVAHGCVDRARTAAGQLAQAALAEGTAVLGHLPPSDDLSFLLELPSFVVRRDR